MLSTWLGVGRVGRAGVEWCSGFERKNINLQKSKVILYSFVPLKYLFDRPKPAHRTLCEEAIDDSYEGAALLFPLVLGREGWDMRQRSS